MESHAIFGVELIGVLVCFHLTFPGAVELFFGDVCGRIIILGAGREGRGEEGEEKGCYDIAAYRTERGNNTFHTR